MAVRTVFTATRSRNFSPVKSNVSHRLLSSSTTKIPLCWLDLRGSGLSALERLCLEEILLRFDSRLWSVVGTHEPTTHRWLQTSQKQLPPYISASTNPNPSCIIVMGLGGKPKELLDIDAIQHDGVQVLKRFSGGGTVVLDHNSLWTTMIGRTAALPHVEAFPRPIMQYTADALFGPAFHKLNQTGTSGMASEPRALMQPSLKQSTLVVDSKSCSATENSGRVLRIPTSNSSSDTGPIRRSTNPPAFSLRENDYVLGQHKMGGNAQSIVKEGWLHHTSFLWDFDSAHMGYLTLPSRRPDYRQDRPHEDFLVKLNAYYESPRVFFDAVKEVCREEFDVETVTVRQVMGLVQERVGGLQAWFEGKSRNKFVDVSSV